MLTYSVVVLYTQQYQARSKLSAGWPVHKGPRLPPKIKILLNKLPKLFYTETFKSVCNSVQVVTHEKAKLTAINTEQEYILLKKMILPI